MIWSEFFHMGGYAFYVWTSWGLSLALCALIFILAKRRNANIRRQLLTNQQREQKFKS